MKIFDEKIDRKNTSSVKWDGMKAAFGKNELLPMWVADMDFRPPSEVLDAMKKRVEHGVFGYTIIGDTTANAIINWISKRHQWDIKPSWLLYSPGVVPSIGMAIRAFTEVGDKVMLQSPVYTPFFNMIESNMREVVNSPLVLKDGRYEIDFVDFEEKLKSGVKLFLLCSPHNPAGRVWSKEELMKIAELCREYGVIIASDEIHADIVAPPHKHFPICSLDPSFSDLIITFMAPSKTFNLAGLQSSFMVVQNAEIRKKIEDIQKNEGFHTLNTFGIIAMEAAYQYGEKWLDDATAYIRENIEILQKGIETELPDLEVIKPEGTYLVWVDCRKTGLSANEIRKRLIEKGRLAVNFGDSYGPGGEGFIRFNTACPRSIIEEGIERLKLAFS
ncbi:pyridoxal phosphate-dependent aminotransferase [Bacillus sp. FJAT-49732]|uniref:cysteine-S-conjugate beta-lyase n=1 Tax=Lederbergia citrisecunda TaxID=2833583 RepID=A0A942TMS0_9BACI|nr:MalY/PatB family protein [Lederbergia citrisecunda]MBS4200143.1 pyridoxal phosphate-dependent aminotransferase [Lederbergia citrisecunda]